MTPFWGVESAYPFHTIVYFDSKMAPTTQVKKKTSKTYLRGSTSSEHEDAFQC